MQELIQLDYGQGKLDLPERFHSGIVRCNELGGAEELHFDPGSARLFRSTSKSQCPARIPLMRRGDLGEYEDGRSLPNTARTHTKRHLRHIEPDIIG